ncbi:MAG: O-antigen ligase family protein [bacterium]|nr:O-antigen ligase family protein [bacterium]
MTTARLILFLLALVLPVALWTGSTSYEPAKLLLWGVSGAVWLALAGKATLRRNPPATIPTGVTIAILSHAVVIAPGLLQADTSVLALRVLLWSALWWLVVIVAAATLRAKQDRVRLLACATAGAAAAGMVSLLQIANLLPSTATWNVPIGIGTLGNENFVAELAAIWLVPSLILPASTRDRARRLAACAPTAVLLAVLVASSASGARAAALAAVGLIATGEMLLRSRRGHRAPLVLGGLVVVTALAAGIFVRGVLDPSRNVTTDASAPGRLFATNHGVERRTDWLVASRIHHDSPLIGCGAGSYGAQWLRHRAAMGADPRYLGLATEAPTVTRAHNEYLQWAAETGWVGLAWLMAVVVAGSQAWVRSWRRIGSHEGRRELLIYASGLAAAAVIALVSFPAHLPASGLSMALLVGLPIAAASASPSTGVAARRERLPRAIAIPFLAAAILLATVSVRAFEGDLLLARGQRLFTAGESEPSVGWLQRGLTRTIWPGEGRLYLGLALAGEQRLTEAAAQLEASLRDRPSFEAPLALAEIAADQGRAADAARWLDLVEGCSPPAGIRQQAGYLRAYALLRTDRTAEAEAGFAAMVAADRLDHRSWLGLGFTRAIQGDRAGAAGAYRSAIAALEESLAAPRPSTVTERGKVLRLRRHLEAARRALASTGS